MCGIKALFATTGISHSEPEGGPANIAAVCLGKLRASPLPIKQLCMWVPVDEQS